MNVLEGGAVHTIIASVQSRRTKTMLSRLVLAALPLSSKFIGMRCSLLMHVPKKTPPLSVHRFVAEWSQVKHRHSQAERENAGAHATNLSVGFSDFRRPSLWRGGRDGYVGNVVLWGGTWMRHDRGGGWVVRTLVFYVFKPEAADKRLKSTTLKQRQHPKSFTTPT